MGAMGDEAEQVWSGQIACGCGKLNVLLRGPAHLFVRRSTMLQYACGEEHPFTEEADGRLICMRCDQEITATTGAERAGEVSADEDT